MSTPMDAQGSAGPDERIITLPIHGAAALRQVLGIMDDHDAWADRERGRALDERLTLPWSGVEWEQLTGSDHGIPFTRADATMIVNGLRYTEMMSMELPFFEQVVAVSSWIIDQLDEAFPGVAAGGRWPN